MSTITINVINSCEDGISAYAGGGQANATLLDSQFSIVETVTTTGDSCKLDAATVGKVREVTNLDSNDMDLFPASGEKFFIGTTDNGVNVAYPLGAGNSTRFICYTLGIWRTF